MTEEEMLKILKACEVYIYDLEKTSAPFFLSQAIYKLEESPGRIVKDK
jgi:hypothetical protein